MKNKKRIKIGILLVVILVAVIGMIAVNKMNEPTEKEKQIAFLQAHEEEMTEYVKNKSEYVLLKKYNVQVVKYNWESVNEAQSMAFSPKTLAIEVDIFDANGTSLDGFEIYIIPDSIKSPSIIKDIK